MTALEGKELSLYRRINEILETPRFSDLFDQLLHEITLATGAEDAFVFVFDAKTNSLVPTAVTDRLRVFFSKTNFSALIEPSLIALKKRTAMAGRGKGNPIRSLIVVPLYSLSGEAPLAVFGAINKRNSSAFAEGDERLLSVIAEQLRHSLQYRYLSAEVGKQKKELGFIRQFDNLVDRVQDFQEFVERATQEFASALDAEMSLTLLRKGKDWKIVFANDAARKLRETRLPLQLVLDAVSRRQKAALYVDLMNSKKFDLKLIERCGVRTALCAPIYSAQNGAVMGAFLLANKHGGGNFSVEDSTLFASMAGQADAAVFREREKGKLRSAFKRYVSEKVVNEILKDPEALGLGGKRQEVTILFGDLRGFTPMAEKMDPQELVRYLNEYFAKMTAIIFKHNGMVDKYIGDSIMALFGAPFTHKEDALNAVRAGLEMQQVLAKLNEKWSLRGEIVHFNLGIGINCGEVVVGNIGGPEYMNYTAIGDNVNLAARLESNALAGQILASESVFNKIRSKVVGERLPPLKVKGKSEPVRAFAIKKLK